MDLSDIYPVFFREYEERERVYEYYKNDEIMLSLIEDKNVNEYMINYKKSAEYDYESEIKYSEGSNDSNDSNDSDDSNDSYYPDYPFLHYICSYSSNRVIRTYIEKYEINKSDMDDEENTMFHHLCGNKQATIEIFKYFYDKYKEDIIKLNMNNELPLHVACSKLNNLENIKYMIDVTPCDFLTAKSTWCTVDRSTPIQILEYRNDTAHKDVESCIRENIKEEDAYKEWGPYFDEIIKYLEQKIIVPSQ